MLAIKMAAPPVLLFTATIITSTSIRVAYALKISTMILMSQALVLMDVVVLIVVLEAAVPGMMVDDLEVAVFQDGNQKYVRLNGKSVAHCREVGNTVYVQEIKRSSFSRVMPVPNDAVGDPRVMLQNGILNLSWKLATVAVEEKEKKIPITVS